MCSCNWHHPMFIRYLSCPASDLLIITSHGSAGLSQFTTGVTWHCLSSGKFSVPLASLIQWCCVTHLGELLNMGNPNLWLKGHALLFLGLFRKRWSSLASLCRGQCNTSSLYSLSILFCSILLPLYSCSLGSYPSINHPRIKLCCRCNFQHRFHLNIMLWV